MNQLERHLGRSLLAAFALVCLVFCSLSLLVGLIEEGSALRPGYQWPQALIYVASTLPASLNQVLPAGVLLGSLLGLGQLAMQSELTIMRACGWSKLRIFGGCAKTVLVLMLVQWLLAEWVVPPAEQWADRYRDQSLANGQMVRSASGIWTREGQDVVHIGEVFPDGLLLNLTLFRFDQNQQIQQIIKAERAEPVVGGWQLRQIRQTQLAKRPIEASTLAEQLWMSRLDLKQLQTLSVSPDKLSMRELWRYRQHLLDNGQQTIQQELAFYNKLLQPLSQPVLLLLALCFLFGSQRSQSFGQRMVYGVLLGFAYSLSTKMLNSMTVYGWPAWLIALFPSLLFGVPAWFWLRRD